LLAALNERKVKYEYLDNPGEALAIERLQDRYGHHRRIGAGWIWHDIGVCR